MKLFQIAKRIVVVGMIFCPTVWSCTKKNASGNPYALPPATQTGADVMACYLDSSTWVIENNYQNTGDFSAGMGTNDTFFIAGYPLPGYTPYRAIHTLQLEIFNHFQVGVPYAANDSSHIIFFYLIDSTCQGGNLYEIPLFTPVSGTVTLTKFDYNSRIMSGVFNAKFVISDCNDTVTLRDGWFDLRF
jgi:hypothetical protein